MFFNNTFLDSPFGTAAVLVSSNSFVPKGTCLLTKFNSGKPQSQKNVPSFSGNGSFFTTLLKPEKTGKTQIRVFQSRSGKTKELFAMGPGCRFPKTKKRQVTPQAMSEKGPFFIYFRSRQMDVSRWQSFLWYPDFYRNLCKNPSKPAHNIQQDCLKNVIKTTDIRQYWWFRLHRNTWKNNISKRPFPFILGLCFLVGLIFMTAPWIAR